MASKPTLEELLSGVPAAVLDNPCSEDHLMELALTLTDWRTLAFFLRLQDHLEDIEEQSKSVREKNINMLLKWRKKAGERATYRSLASVLWKLDQTNLVEKIRDLLLIPTDMQALQLGPPKSATQSFAEYLKRRYRAHKPLSRIEWPPSPTRKYFNLALIKKERVERGPPEDAVVRMAMEGHVSDVLERKVPVELKNILTADNAPRKVVLVEGVAGSGKSTLSWHICQEWEELFREFNLVVFVQLRDPVVQRAQSISNLLPCPDEETTEGLISEMKANEGKGVLFVLDGWDELPPSRQQESIFRDLIIPPLTSLEAVKVLQSTVIVTSRPESSGELHELVSSRVEIMGFTPKEVEEYFGDALEGDSQKVEKLLEQVREHPLVESSCYLPLNAVIIVSLFLAMNHTLPATMTDIFASLILCCIMRHLKARTDLKIDSLTSLDSLPTVVQEPFDSLCQLAFHGVLENKVTFSAEELGIHPEFATLSLMQAVDSFVCIATVGTSRTYNFLHLSIQELLAARYISKWTPDEQTDILYDLLGHPRFTGVFQFYAGITKLQAPATKKLVDIIITEFANPLLEIEQQTNRKMLVLLNCLHEVQDASLYQYVAAQVKGKSMLFFAPGLSPVESLSLGHFLPWICHTVGGLTHVDVEFTTSQSMKLFVKGLVKSVCNRQSCNPIGGLEFFMNYCLQEDTMPCLAQLLQSSSSCYVRKLSINYLDDRTVDLKCLSEALVSNRSLLALKCSLQITHQNGPALCRMLEKNKTLQTLTVYGTRVTDVGALYIGRGLLSNTTLRKLSLHYCGITADGAKTLAEALIVNRSLEILNLCGNRISDEGIHHLAEVLKHNTTLRVLNVTGCDMTEIGLESLANSLTVNKTVEHLLFDLEKFDEDSDKPVTTITALRKRLWDSGVLQQLLKISIERTVREFGEEWTFIALFDLLQDWRVNNRFYFLECYTRP